MYDVSEFWCNISWCVYTGNSISHEQHNYIQAFGYEDLGHLTTSLSKVKYQSKRKGGGNIELVGREISVIS